MKRIILTETLCVFIQSVYGDIFYKCNVKDSKIYIQDMMKVKYDKSNGVLWNILIYWLECA